MVPMAHQFHLCHVTAAVTRIKDRLGGLSSSAGPTQQFRLSDIEVDDLSFNGVEGPNDAYSYQLDQAQGSCSWRLSQSPAHSEFSIPSTAPRFSELVRQSSCDHRRGGRIGDRCVQNLGRRRPSLVDCRSRTRAGLPAPAPSETLCAPSHQVNFEGSRPSPSLPPPPRIVREDPSHQSYATSEIPRQPRAFLLRSRE